MIPIRLRVSGFLSYRDPVELDFTRFDIACISGANGAGKSTLLDAITWALFGQARKRDDSLVNLQSQAAEVVLTFQYERNIYRVQRSQVRGKTPILEFQILQTDSGAADPPPENWRPLTERTLRETQARIEQALGLDYETFVNASFFLQGKADQFTQQSPAKRKEVLGNILGMESWDELKSRTADSRRTLEAELTSVEGRLAEIGAELADELPRKQRLAELESELGRLAPARKAQETALEIARRTKASLDGQQRLIESMQSAAEQARVHLKSLEERLADRAASRLALTELTARSTGIEGTYRLWKESVKGLEEWDRLASSFRQQERDRLPLVAQIAAEQARLEQEHRGLLAQKLQVERQSAAVESLESDLQAALAQVAEAEARTAQRDRLQAEHAAARQASGNLKAENEILKGEMDKIKSRLDFLHSASGATCPLCGQPLSPQHRESTLQSLEAEGKHHGDRFRANKAAAEKLDSAVAQLDSSLALLVSAGDDQLTRSRAAAQLNERLESLRSLRRSWESDGAAHLSQLASRLERADYAVDLRGRLTQIDQKLLALGYDAAAHDAARQSELRQRVADDEFHRLESARAALAPLEKEIHGLEAELASRRAEAAAGESQLAEALRGLEAARVDLPDIAKSEALLFELQEQENRINQQIGAARQRVTVLDDLRVRASELGASRQELALKISRHKVLERAFGKDGVPALLIEQALPEIQNRANDVLDRLSDGQMSVHFMTQAGYKDKKRGDLKETLEIQISDGAGARDYEMYSGGEAFRVDFAVRLALSEVLAGRKGARLQTLVIDEGFASQDSQGRQRLIEAINLVKHDFAKVLLITHLDELKDAFPTRIEVEKTERGSTITVF